MEMYGLCGQGMYPWRKCHTSLAMFILVQCSKCVLDYMYRSNDKDSGIEMPHTFGNCNKDDNCNELQLN